jgi:hypothetical protein
VIDGAAGVTAMDTSAAAVTVSVADPVTPPTLIVIVVPPTASALARPWIPGVSEIVASVPLLELQCPAVVTSCVVPSAYVPIAANRWLTPAGTVPSGGDTAMDTS